VLLIYHHSDVSGNAKVRGILDVSGNTNIDGNLAIKGSKFTVDATSGNVSTTGTIDVTGATRLASTLDVSGNTNMTGTLTTSSLATMNSGTCCK
jgi:cytoskeletal protein CcmA (bactofilin family)